MDIENILLCALGLLLVLMALDAWMARRAARRERWAPIPTVTDIWGIEACRVGRVRALESRVELEREEGLQHVLEAPITVDRAAVPPPWPGEGEWDDRSSHMY